MRVTILDAPPPGLDELAAEAGTFYHTTVWIESLRAAYPRMGFRCAVAYDGDAVAGTMPFFEVRRGAFSSVWSLPFGTYGGPVVRDGAPAGAAEALVRAFEAHAGGWSVVAAAWVDYGAAGPAAGVGWREETVVTHVADLSEGFDRFWAEAVDRQRRKRARQGRRAGVTVRRSRSAGDVAAFYAVYRRRLGAWGRRDGHPERLFRELVARGGDRVRLYVAEHEGRILGGHVNFLHRDEAVCWAGVTTFESRSLHADTLLYEFGIRDAAEAGARRVNLGGSLGRPSLVAFKESLGGRPRPYRVVRRRSGLAGLVRVFARRRGRR